MLILALSLTYAIVLWELFTQQLPFSDVTDLSTLPLQILISNLRPTPLPTTSQCPKELTDLIVKCWSSDPNERLSFAEIIAQLSLIEEAIIPGTRFKQVMTKLTEETNEETSKMLSWKSIFADLKKAICPICSNPERKLDLEQESTWTIIKVIPSEFGGPNHSWNFIPACTSCRYIIRVHIQTKDNLVDYMGLKDDTYKANLKKLFLRKYEYIIPKNQRNGINQQELIEFVQSVYCPKELNSYKSCLLLSNTEIAALQSS